MIEENSLVKETILKTYESWSDISSDKSFIKEFFFSKIITEANSLGL